MRISQLAFSPFFLHLFYFFVRFVLAFTLCTYILLSIAFVPNKNPKGVKLKHSIKIKMKKRSDGRQRRARCGAEPAGHREGARWPIRTKANGWNITLTCTVFNFRLVSFHLRTHLPVPYTVLPSSSSHRSPGFHPFFHIPFVFPFRSFAIYYIGCECKHPLSSMRLLRTNNENRTCWSFGTGVHVTVVAATTQGDERWHFRFWASLSILSYVGGVS